MLTTGAPLPPQEFERFRTAQDAQGTPTGRLDPHMAPPRSPGHGHRRHAGSTGAGLASGPGMGSPGPGWWPGGTPILAGMCPVQRPRHGRPRGGRWQRPQHGCPGMGGTDHWASPGGPGYPRPSMDAAPPRASMPSGAAGGSVGAGDGETSRPSSAAARAPVALPLDAGANPHAVTSYDDPSAPAVGPEADDGTHTTLGGQSPTGGSGSGSGQ